MSLKQNIKKIKGYLQEYLQGYILVLIVFFGVVDIYMIGFLSNYDRDLELKVIFDPEFEITAEDLQKNNANNNADVDPNKTIVASKNGTKYYFVWCSGVGRIKDENKVYFMTEEEAIESGYDRAQNCQ